MDRLPTSRHSTTPFARALLGSSIAICLFIFQTAYVSANACDATCDSDDEGANIQCLEDKRECLEDRIDETRAEEQTLQSAISILNGKVAIQQVQINRTLSEIRKLQTEISNLDDRISGLEVSLDRLTSMLISRVREQYIQSKTAGAPLQSISQDSFADLMSQYQYISLAGKQTAHAMERAESQRLIFDEQKSEKEVKQIELETIELRLEQEQAELDTQKQEKANLLAVTQHNESRYQDMLAATKADLESIQRALASAASKVGDVERGEIVAAVGNSGCSTGAHLHFELFKDAKVEDGIVYGTRVDPGQYIEDGTLAHPLPNSILTADYGISYILGTHTGMDFAYPYNDRPTLGAPIYAADSGVAYRTQDTQPCYLTGTVGKGLLIDHENGFVTLYWHLP